MTIPFYPMMVGLASGIGIELSRYLYLKNGEKGFWKICIVLLSLGWLGAKTLFLITSSLDASFFSGGGFVFYGGLLGGLLGCFVLRLSSPQIDLLIPGLAFAHSIGRLGCFIAGCCHGKICPIPGINYYPTQIFEATFLFILGIYFLKKIQKKGLSQSLWTNYLLFYALFRFFNEFLRGDHIRGIYLALSTSQWVSIGLIILVAFKKLFR